MSQNLICKRRDGIVYENINISKACLRIVYKGECVREFVAFISQINTET